MSSEVIKYFIGRERREVSGNRIFSRYDSISLFLRRIANKS